MGHRLDPLGGLCLLPVELFCSILERRLLKHGELDSVEDLADRIVAFIRDYNRHAQPFRWTYDGRPLKVA